MKPKVYVTRLISAEGLDLLRTVCAVEVNPDDRPQERAELLAKIRDKDGVIGLLTDRIDAEFFDAAPKLKGYANYAVGFDNIDVAEATRRGIPVSNTPGVLTEATVELAQGRSPWPGAWSRPTRSVRSGQWTGWGPLQFLGADVCGKTLGIVGAGRIGTAMALMSRGFRMPVVYSSSSGRRNDVLENELNARLVLFEELLAQSDFISLHAPLTPQSRHLFNAGTFARMKNTAILINTGRGPLIKEDDLVAALREGEIGGAGLDVYEFEPRMAQGLAELPNTVLLPHVGSATTSTRANMAVMAARNLLAMLEGSRPETCLNPEVLGGAAGPGNEIAGQPVSPRLARDWWLPPPAAPKSWIGHGWFVGVHVEGAVECTRTGSGLGKDEPDQASELRRWRRLLACLKCTRDLAGIWMTLPERGVASRAGGLGAHGQAAPRPGRGTDSPAWRACVTTSRKTLASGVRGTGVARRGLAGAGAAGASVSRWVRDGVSVASASARMSASSTALGAAGGAWLRRVSSMSRAISGASMSAAPGSGVSALSFIVAAGVSASNGPGAACPLSRPPHSCPPHRRRSARSGPRSAHFLLRGPGRSKCHPARS